MRRRGPLSLSGVLLTACALWFRADAQEAGPQIVLQLGHAGQINSIAYGSDGRLLASGGEDGTGDGQVAVWDTAAGRMVKKYRAGKWSWAASILSDHLPVEHVLSPDGRVLAARSKYEQSVGLFDATTGAPLRSLPGAMAEAVAFSPDAKLIAAAHPSGESDKVTLWETGTGKELRSFNLPSGRVVHPAFSPNGRAVAGSTINYKDNIRVWDASSGKELPPFTASHTGGADFSFTPDGKALILAGGRNQIKLIDVETRKELRAFETPGGTPAAFAFSRSGKLLAGAFGKTVTAWNVATGQIVLKLEGHASYVNALAFSHDARVIATGSSDSRVALWDAATGERLLDLVALADQDWLGLASDGRYDGTPGSLQWMRAVRGTQPASPESFTAAPFTPRLMVRQLYGRLAAVKQKPADEPGAADRAPSVKIQSPAPGLVSGAEGVEVSVAVTDSGGGLGRVLLFQNGRKVGEQAWSALDGEAGVVVGVVKFGVDLLPGVNELSAVATSFYGKESAPAVVRVEHRVETAKLLNPTLVVQTGHKSSVLAVSFNANGSVLASAGADNTVVLWDAATGKQVRALGGQWEVVHSSEFSLAFGPDGRTLAGRAVIPPITGVRGSRCTTLRCGTWRAAASCARRSRPPSAPGRFRSRNGSVRAARRTRAGKARPAPRATLSG